MKDERPAVKTLRDGGPDAPLRTRRRAARHDPAAAQPIDHGPGTRSRGAALRADQTERGADAVWRRVADARSNNARRSECLARSSEATARWHHRPAGDLIREHRRLQHPADAGAPL